jgi:hypothetical protein
MKNEIKQLPRAFAKSSSSLMQQVQLSCATFDFFKDHTSSDSSFIITLKTRMLTMRSYEPMIPFYLVKTFAIHYISSQNIEHIAKE